MIRQLTLAWLAVAVTCGVVAGAAEIETDGRRLRRAANIRSFQRRQDARGDDNEIKVRGLDHA